LAFLRVVVVEEKPAMWGATIVGYGEYETPTGK